MLRNFLQWLEVQVNQRQLPHEAAATFSVVNDTTAAAAIVGLTQGAGCWLVCWQDLLQRDHDPTIFGSCCGQIIAQQTQLLLLLLLVLLLLLLLLLPRHARAPAAALLPLL